jgi:hypothetical protein
MDPVDLLTLATIRQATAGYFPTPVDICNQVQALDAFGRPTTTLTTAATVKGQVSQVTGRDQALVQALANAGRLGELTAVLSLPWGTPLVDTQVVRIAGVVWNVAWVDADTSLAASVKAIITRRKVTPDDQAPL